MKMGQNCTTKKSMELGRCNYHHSTTILLYNGDSTRMSGHVPLEEASTYTTCISEIPFQIKAVLPSTSSTVRLQLN